MIFMNVLCLTKLHAFKPLFGLQPPCCFQWMRRADDYLLLHHLSCALQHHFELDSETSLYNAHNEVDCLADSMFY